MSKWFLERRTVTAFIQRTHTIFQIQTFCLALVKAGQASRHFRGGIQLAPQCLRLPHVGPRLDRYLYAQPSTRRSLAA